jgi:hypothetical protein
VRLEPDEGKLSSPVLRGPGRSNPARLPDLWTLLDEEAYAPGLVAGKILVDDAPAREYQREFVVWNFGGWSELDGVKFRSAVGVIKPLFEKPRSARVIFRWARPEDTVLPLNLLVGNAVVVGVPAF